MTLTNTFNDFDYCRNRNVVVNMTDLCESVMHIPPFHHNFYSTNWSPQTSKSHKQITVLHACGVL